MQLCSSEECERKIWAKGYCSKHYYWAQRHGLLPRPTCSVEDCGEPSFRKGMCNKHHLRTRRYGDPHIRLATANGETCNSPCTIDGCGKLAKGRGLCSIHIGRKRHHGDPLAVPKKLGNGKASEARKRENSLRAQKTYYTTPHGKLRRRYANAKRRVIEGHGSVHIDKDQFLELWAAETCALCAKAISDVDKTIDHIIPLSRGGSNDISNMQIAHLLCNQRKGNRLIVQEAA